MSLVWERVLVIWNVHRRMSTTIAHAQACARDTSPEVKRRASAPDNQHSGGSSHRECLHYAPPISVHVRDSNHPWVRHRWIHQGCACISSDSSTMGFDAVQMSHHFT